MDDGFHRVLATPQQRKEIERNLKCSQALIYFALKFQNNGLLSRKIRSYAINILKCPVV